MHVCVGACRSDTAACRPHAQVLLARGPYDAALVDVWAAGVVLFLMLTGRLPFCHEDNHAAGVLDRAMMQRILKGQCVLPAAPAVYRLQSRASDCSNSSRAVLALLHGPSAA